MISNYARYNHKCQVFFKDFFIFFQKGVAK